MTEAPLPPEVGHDVELVGVEVVEGGVPVAAVATGGLGQLAAERLDGFDSAHTRRAYRTDLVAWLRFCYARGVDPLTARRAEANRWARELSAAG